MRLSNAAQTQSIMVLMKRWLALVDLIRGGGGEPDVQAAADNLLVAAMILAGCPYDVFRHARREATLLMSVADLPAFVRRLQDWALPTAWGNTIQDDVAA